MKSFPCLKIAMAWLLLMDPLQRVSSMGETNKVLIIDSDVTIEKYSLAEKEFRSGIKLPNVPLHLEGKESDEDLIASTIQKEKPALIYCVGSKACQMAIKLAPKSPIVFSSLLNWRRLNIGKKTFGIANELHPGMQLTLYRYLFPHLKRIGILYSKTYNKEWVETAIQEAEKTGTTLIPEAVVKTDQVGNSLNSILGKVDALWLIADPVVLAKEEVVKDIFGRAAGANKPVFAYDESFLEYGPLLVISVDPETVGRQAAALSNNVLSGMEIQERVQPPAGTTVILNMRKVKEYQLELNHEALDSVQRIVQ